MTMNEELKDDGKEILEMMRRKTFGVNNEVPPNAKYIERRKIRKATRK